MGHTPSSYMHCMLTFAKKGKRVRRNQLLVNEVVRIFFQNSKNIKVYPYASIQFNNLPHLPTKSLLYFKYARSFFLWGNMDVQECFIFTLFTQLQNKDILTISLKKSLRLCGFIDIPQRMKTWMKWSWLYYFPSV